MLRHCDCSPTFEKAASPCAGEVRTSGDPAQAGPDLVIDVAELIWEPIAD
jgi:hypothetical protein